MSRRSIRVQTRSGVPSYSGSTVRKGHFRKRGKEEAEESDLIREGSIGV